MLPALICPPHQRETGGVAEIARKHVPQSTATVTHTIHKSQPLSAYPVMNALGHENITLIVLV